MPTKRAMIRMAWEQHCEHEDNWILTRWQERWFAIKVIICILLNLFYDWDYKDDAISVACWGMKPTSHYEYSGWDWDDLIVMKDRWGYLVYENSSV